MNAAIVISFFCAAFCLFVFFYTKWYIKRHGSAKELLREYRDEVLRLNAQIDATTDRDMRLIEERISALKALLEETDKRVSLYVRELQRSRSGEEAYKNLRRAAAALPASAPAPPPEGGPENVGEKADKKADEKAAAPRRKKKTAKPRRAQAGAELSADTMPQGAQSQGSLNQGSQGAPELQAADASDRAVREQVARMSHAGLPPAEIALRLNLSRSQVDLVLNLQGKR